MLNLIERAFKQMPFTIKVMVVFVRLDEIPFRRDYSLMALS